MEREEIKRAAFVIGESDPRVRQVILFGSYARKQQRPDSDVDLALVVKPGVLHAVRTDVEVLARRNLEEAGFIAGRRVGEFHALALPEQDIERARKGLYGEDALLNNIAREGQVVWDENSCLSILLIKSI